jgi:hypothetical protein
VRAVGKCGYLNDPSRKGPFRTLKAASQDCPVRDLARAHPRRGLEKQRQKPPVLVVKAMKVRFGEIPIKKSFVINRFWCVKLVINSYFIEIIIKLSEKTIIRRKPPRLP